MKTKSIFALLFGLCWMTQHVQAQGCTTELSSINENFNAIAHGSLPTCWTRHSGVTGANVFNGVSNTNQQYNLIWQDTNGNPDQLAPQSFIVAMQRCTMLGPVGFKVARPLSSVWQWPFEVGTMSDPNNPATFVPLYAFYPTSSTQVSYSVDLSGYTGSDEYIAFRTKMGEGNTFTFDDVTFSGPPAIAPPSQGPARN